MYRRHVAGVQNRFRLDVVFGNRRRRAPGREVLPEDRAGGGVGGGRCDGVGEGVGGRNGDHEEVAVVARLVRSGETLIRSLLRAPCAVEVRVATVVVEATLVAVIGVPMPSPMYSRYSSVPTLTGVTGIRSEITSRRPCIGMTDASR